MKLVPGTEGADGELMVPWVIFQAFKRSLGAAFDRLRPSSTVSDRLVMTDTIDRLAAALADLPIGTLVRKSEVVLDILLRL